MTTQNKLEGSAKATAAVEGLPDKPPAPSTAPTPGATPETAVPAPAPKPAPTPTPKAAPAPKEEPNLAAGVKLPPEYIACIKKAKKAGNKTAIAAHSVFLADRKEKDKRDHPLFKSFKRLSVGEVAAIELALEEV